MSMYYIHVIYNIYMENTYLNTHLNIFKYILKARNINMSFSMSTHSFHIYGQHDRKENIIPDS